MRFRLHNRILAIMFTMLCMGCETTDRMLTATERAVGSRTGQTVVEIIEGKDRSQIAKRRLDEYAKDPERLLQDLRAAQRDFKTLYEALGGKVSEQWGKKEVKLPQQKKYVKYTQSYKSRAIVDFDSGKILVETLDDQDPRRSLRNAIVTTLLTPQDPRAVDLFSDKEIPLSTDREPYLFGLVVDQHGKSIRTPTEAEPFADYLLASDRTGWNEENVHLRQHENGGEPFTEAGGEISSGGGPVRATVHHKPQSRLCDYPHGKQLQSLCRELRAGLWPDAAGSDQRRPRGISARKR